jgi:hypothetical protein
MNPRHAAALALVGWYLMFPPTSRDYPTGNVDAPLTQWLKRPTTYRNKDECEHVLDRDIRRTNSKNRQVWVNIYKLAQCVSTDDPRFKEK